MKRFLCVLLTLVIVLPLLTLPASATLYTIVENGLTIADSKSNSSYSDGVVTITGKGGLFSGTENTVTITNTSSNKANITFDYTATGYSSFTIDGASGSASGSIDWTLAAGASKTLKIKGGSGLGATNGVLTIKNIIYTVLIEGAATITHNELGSVTVDGAAFTSGGTTGTLTETGAALVATPASGASFVAWVNADNNEVLSQSATFQLKPYATAMNIQAVFTKADQPAYFMTNDTMYTDLSAALTAASGGDKKVVVISSGTLTAGSTYDIPSTVTLLVPYSTSDYVIDSSTTIDDSGGQGGTLLNANMELVTLDSEGTSNSKVTAVMEPNTSVLYTLTIPSGTIMNVSGKLVVGGALVAGTNSTTGVCGATGGAHSNIQLDGTINVKSGGVLSTCGYILGNGSITAESGGAVYQPFVLLDHKDGHYLYAAKNNNRWPVYRYSIQNIRCPLVLKSGSDMFGYSAVFTRKNTFAAARFNPSMMQVVGSGSDKALFLVNGTSMTMTYQAGKVVSVTSSTNNNSKGYYSKVGTTTMTFNGDASLGSIELSVVVLGSNYNMTSANSEVPIPYNFKLVQNSGTFNVANNMALLPGSTFTVNSGAFMTVASGKSFVIYDGLRDYATRAESVTLDGEDQTGGAWPLYHYPTADNLQSGGFSRTAELIVNGTLTVNGNLGGTVQTGGTTGKIVMGDSAGTSATGTFGVQNKSSSILGMTIGGSCGKTVRTLNPQVFIADSTTPILLQAGKNYVATGNGTNTLSSYTYSVYGTHDGSATTESKTNLNASVTGTWQCADGYHTDEDPADHICEVCGFVTECADAIPEGEMYADHACDICGEVLTECADSDDEDLLCDICGKNLCEHDAEVTAFEEVPATCVAEGHKAYWLCTTCGFYYADEACTTEIPDLEAWLADETETGGKLTALGHTYGEVTYPWTDYNACVATRACTVCTEETEGHTETAEGVITSEDTTPATCKEAGVRTYTATFDVDWAAQQTATEEIAIDETAHAWDNDCDTECNNGCGTIREITHNYDSVVTDPTCTVGGFTTHTCSVCGDSYTDSETAAAGCNYSDEWKTDADNHWQECSVCGEESEKAAHADGNSDHKCDTCEYVMSECSFTVQGDLKTAGTCVAEAVYEAKCSVCGAVSETETIKGEKDSSNHTGNNHTENAEDANCTEAGYTGDTVCECGATVATGTVIDATGHKNTTTTTVDATCTKDGSVTVTCDDCGATISTETIKAAGHSYSSAVTAPTCEADGFTTYTCTCGDSYTGDTVAKLGHDYKLTDSKDATCTEDGYKTYTCKNDASHTYTDTLTKTGHSYESEVTAPTHTEAGYTTYTCSACGDTYKADEVAALGHSYTSEETKAPTCTEKGVKTFTCTCGDTYTEEVAALGHAEVSHEAKAPTCTEIGWDAYVTCSRCDYTTYAEKSALGHTEVVDEAVAPTCTETGLTEGKHCSVCGEVLVAQEVVKALGHTEVVDEAVAPTCTETGLTEGKHCSICGEVLDAQEVVAALGHTEVIDEAVAATCTETGLTEGKHCSVCGEVLVAQEIVDAGHSIEQGEAQSKTCTQDGWAAYEYCTECDYTTKVVIPAGHTLTQVEAKAPTCTETGYDAYEYCSECNYTTYKVTPVVDHVFTNYVGNDELKTAYCDYGCGATDVKIENADSDTAVDITPDTTDSDKVNAEVGKEQLDKVIEENLDIQMNTGVLELIFENQAVQDIVKDLEAKDKVTINVENATPENAENSVRFDIYIAVNDKKQESTKFSGEYVTVTIDLAQLEDTLGDPTKDVEIWYVDENGDRIEKMDHEKDGTKVKFKTNHFSYYEVVAVDESEPEEISYTVSFVNYTTSGENQATIKVGDTEVEYQQKTAVEATLGEDGTFNVSCAKACVVAYTTDSGETYTEVYAVANDDGTYSFTIGEPVENMTIAVVYNGDVDLNGMVNGNDALRIQRYYAGMTTNNAKISVLGYIAANVDGNTTVNGNDALRIQRNYAGMTTNNAKIDWHIKK